MSSLGGVICSKCFKALLCLAITDEKEEKLKLHMFERMEKTSTLDYL